MEEKHFMNKKPRKIPIVKPSKYEITEAIHTNKKYWDRIFKNMHTSNETVVSDFNFLSSKGQIANTKISLLMSSS